MKVELPDPRRKLRQLAFPLVAPTTPLGVEPRPKERRTGADYDTEWARSFRARWTRTVLLESVLRPTAAAIARPRRRGIDRLADLQGAGEPVIFCANHHSHVDTPIVLTSLPEPWRYQVFVGAAADYFFRNRATGAAASLLLNAIPIERATVTRRSADLAANLIDDGWSMLIFPEGGRSPDGWGQDFRGGAAYLARRTGAPVVPIHLSGTDRILPKGAKRLRPGPTTVTFGDPIRAEEGEDTRRLATRIEAAVAALADEHTSDWYAARVRAHTGDTPGLGGPDGPSWRRAWALGERSPSRRRRAAWPPR
ncbi:1-acyl-sn-glycerol-3-phosphate acyltransferase [Acidimicrobiia bacterium EGI L10123]|uniref:lysophospholipid acyltransferase family protein n=1 Tax=Salinilacustrithrix flava TaxID=2957203 RepID=UPI003D7C1CE0|nr:1-acyl-sn-glycerol-3-phosphate acyltransferase [Acidimicrobiia bacterium EGI L10123]